MNNLGCERLTYTSYTAVYIDVAATRVEAYSKEEYISSEGETFQRYVAQEQLKAWCGKLYIIIHALFLHLSQAGPEANCLST